MAKLKTGDKIPSFTLTDQNGNLFNIDTIKGKKNMVIYCGKWTKKTKIF